MVLMLDTVIALALYFGVKYGAASMVDDVKFIIGIMQPVFLMLIYSITKEDAAKLSKMTFVSSELKTSPAVAPV